MTKKELDALRLIVELAEQNALSDREAVTPELALELGRQDRAIAIVRGLISATNGLVADYTKVLWNGRNVGTTASESRVVKFLSDNAGQYQTYRQIYDVVQRPGFHSGSGAVGYAVNVRSMIKRIRHKLYEVGAGDLIETQPTVGYRWIGSTPLGVEDMLPRHADEARRLLWKAGAK